MKNVQLVLLVINLNLRFVIHVHKDHINQKLVNQPACYVQLEQVRKVLAQKLALPVNLVFMLTNKVK